MEVFQSGFNSTESALIGAYNDILLANDSGDYTILVLLDLNTAVDAVDHKIQIAWLQHHMGIWGGPLDFLDHI